MSPIKSHNFALKQISVTAVSPRLVNKSNATPKRSEHNEKSQAFILLNDQTVKELEKPQKDLGTLENSNSLPSRQKLLNYFMEHKLKNLMDVIEEF
jgi:hypothetical protein